MERPTFTLIFFSNYDTSPPLNSALLRACIAPETLLSNSRIVSFNLTVVAQPLLLISSGCVDGVAAL